MTILDSTTRERIAVLTMDHPPVNGLSFELRRALAQAIREAEQDPAVDAIVLTGTDRAFSGGADIREFNSPRSTSEPNLLTLIRNIEDLRKPVVALIQGLAMGGGLELALGCHYRLATASARIALPEVNIGLIPGAGGTQRMPRLIGVEAATNLIVSGAPVQARAFAGTKLFDAILDEASQGGTEGRAIQIDRAIEFARGVVRDGAARPRVRDLPVERGDGDFFLHAARTAVAAKARGLPAPVACVDAIAASLKQPFDDGMKTERDAFVALTRTPESAGLRHAFFAERAASKIPDLDATTKPRTVASAAVIGSGTMGSGIAMNFATAGIPVVLVDTKAEALDAAMKRIRGLYAGDVKKGRIDEAGLEARMALIRPTTTMADISAADLAIEAVFEDFDVKKDVLRQMDALLRDGAILATNTSTLDVNRLAATTRRPQDVVGLHFFSPAHVMKLLEVVRGEKTAPDVLATALELAKKLRKTAVVAGVCDGFIGNRMLEQYIRQAGFLIEEGATPQQVDRAIEKWGFAMGPFRMGDLAGNDIGQLIRERRRREKPDFVYPTFADKVCALGRFGQKTGKGFYLYQAGSRDAIPDPEIDAMLVEHRQELGIEPRRISDEEIVNRLLLALVNEGAHVLDEGIAMRASDIDLVYLTGYGFPRHRGGPMFQADQMGLFNVVDCMNRFRHGHDSKGGYGDPDFWKPAPLIEQLLREERNFNG